MASANERRRTQLTPKTLCRPTMTNGVKSTGPQNKGMNLTRVGAGARRGRRGAASSWIAAQVMPGVGPTVV